MLGQADEGLECWIGVLKAAKAVTTTDDVSSLHSWSGFQSNRNLCVSSGRMVHHCRIGLAVEQQAVTFSIPIAPIMYLGWLVVSLRYFYSSLCVWSASDVRPPKTRV